MERQDPGAGGVAEDEEGQASPGDPGSQDGAGGHEGPGSGSGGEAGAVPREAPQAAQALSAPGPDGDALPGPMPRIPRPVPLRYIVLVPFRSSVEAEIACHLLTPGAQIHPAAAHQELIVSGRFLAIRLTAEDIDQLRFSISFCLRELLLVIRTMRRILPPFVFVNPNRANRG